MDHCKPGHEVGLGAGILLITPVMGSALIAAVGVDKKAPRGPLLTMEADNVRRLGSGVATHSIANGKLAAIDWVHLESASLAKIQTKAHLATPDQDGLEAALTRYCGEEPVPEE